MRLSCPNCDAQYEVAEDAVPPGGRDVQCSNCGHAWFQMSPDTEAEIADQAALSDAPAGLQPEAAATGTAPPDPIDEDEDEDEEAGSTFDRPPPLKQRPVDDGVLAILREEAERETTARRRDADVALAASMAAATEATRPDVAATISPDVMPVPATPAPAAFVDDGPAADAGLALARSAKGRELLPDIDAIKSTLRAGEDRSGDADDDGLSPGPVAMQRSGSFRGGFLLTTAVGVLLAVLYVTAPGMATRFPATAPALGAYVAGVDDARLWLDGLARQAGDSLRDRKSEAAGSN